MKLIFKGKTTNNDEELQKLGLKETDFLVVMNQVAVSLVSHRNLSQNLKLKPNPSLLSRRNRNKRKRKKKNNQKKNLNLKTCHLMSLHRLKLMNL